MWQNQVDRLLFADEDETLAGWDRQDLEPRNKDTWLTPSLKEIEPSGHSQRRSNSKTAALTAKSRKMVNADHFADSIVQLELDELRKLEAEEKNVQYYNRAKDKHYQRLSSGASNPRTPVTVKSMKYGGEMGPSEGCLPRLSTPSNLVRYLGNTLPSSSFGQARKLRFVSADYYPGEHCEDKLPGIDGLREKVASDVDSMQKQKFSGKYFPVSRQRTAATRERKPIPLVQLSMASQLANISRASVAKSNSTPELRKNQGRSKIRKQYDRKPPSTALTWEMIKTLDRRQEFRQQDIEVFNEGKTQLLS